MHTILITGGSGFIGQALVRNFISKNYYVINFDLHDHVKINSKKYLKMFVYKCRGRYLKEKFTR